MSSVFDGRRYARRSTRIDAPSFADDPLDEELLGLADEWEHLSDERLRLLADRLSPDDHHTLLIFAHRTMVLGLRSGDPQWPRAALRAIAVLTPERADPRDLTWAAGVVAYTLNRLVTSAVDEIRRTAATADPSTRQILFRFADDPPRELSEWGYAVFGTGSDLTIAGHEHEPWHPRSDLVGVARRTAAAIDGEGSYTSSSITVATRLPSVWLRGSPDEARALRMLEGGLAAVSVRSEPVTHDRPGDHMFVAFITEFTEPSHADLMARSATLANGDFARLAVSNGPLVTVLIARSVVVDVPDLEENVTLQRFRAPLADALVVSP